MSVTVCTKWKREFSDTNFEIGNFANVSTEGFISAKVKNGAKTSSIQSKHLQGFPIS